MEQLLATEAKTHRVVVIGGGFGRLQATQCLKRVPVTLTLIDRRNFHLFQPLLYQVATGWLSPANIASTLRAILKHHKNTHVLLAEVVGIDVANRQVLLNKDPLTYDTVIVATGSRHHYFGSHHWEPFAPALKRSKTPSRFVAVFLPPLRSPNMKLTQSN